MQRIRNLFLKYQHVSPHKKTGPFIMPPEGSISCPPEVWNSFSDLTHTTTYTFNKNRISFFHEGEDCDTMIQHVARMLHVIQVKPIVAEIYLSPVLKSYPENRVFGESHLNTGYCDGKMIVVYRREEWFKVFIHECMHYFRSEEVLDHECTEILTMFHKKQVNVFETYCELCARVLNCCYISAITHIPVNCLYEIERQYSIQNMVNVLHHMNLEYADLFDPHEFKEDTNAFAYIVLTAILMHAKVMPDYHPDTKFKLLSDDSFIQAVLKGAKSTSLFHDVHTRTPSITTTMTKLNVDEFVLHH